MIGLILRYGFGLHNKDYVYWEFPLAYDIFFV